MGNFDDLIPKKVAGAFDDLMPETSEEAVEKTGAFDDLISKGFTPRVPISHKGISTITGKPTSGLETIPQVNLEPTSFLRPMEFAFSPLTAFRAAIIAGLKKKIEGANMKEQAEEMLEWFNAGLGEWARPIGEKPITPLPTDITGHKGGLGFIENMLLDPSNLLLFGGLKGIAPRIAGTMELGKGRRAAAGARISELYPERAISPNIITEGIPSKRLFGEFKEPVLGKIRGPAEMEFGGTYKNLPAVVPQPKITPSITDDIVRTLSTVMERKTVPKVSSESLMGKTHAEWKLGKKGLKVLEAKIGEETVLRLTDDSGKKVFAELSLKEHPAQNLLEEVWLQIDKNGINISDRRYYRTGKSESIPGLWKEIHQKMELYAKERGYETIGTSPVNIGKERLKAIGFQEVADDLMGEVPYTMYKRVGQNINFEHPNFWEKYRGLKIFEKAGQYGQEQARGIYDKAALRNMSFDLTSDGKWTFFDMYLQPIQKFKTLDAAETFVNSVRLSDQNYLMKMKRFNDAEKLYNLSVEGYIQKATMEASKETASYYKAAAGMKESTALETYRKFVSPETMQKIAKGGEQVKQKVTSSVNEDARAVFDVGTGETVAISGNVPIKESYLTALSQVKDKPDFYERVLTGKSWLMPALHYFERQSKAVKEMFYRRIKVAEKREAQEVRNLEREVNNVASQLGLGKKNFIRIGDYAIAQDAIGKATLEKTMKKVIPELTENEMKFYEYFRNKYEEFFNRINESRSFAGLDPIQYRGDYFTFFRNHDELEKLGYFLNDPQFSKKYEDFVHRMSTPFVHEKLRKGGFIELEENAKDVFMRYAKSAIHHVHMTPPIAINRALIKKFKVGERVYDLERQAPQFHAWVERWLDDIAGQRVNRELPRWLERAANRLNKNITYAFLSYNLRSALIQPSAIVNSFTEVGPKYIVKGISDWMSGANNAIKKSNVILTREYEQGIAEAFKMVREPGYFTKGVELATGVMHPTMRKISRGYVGGKQALARVGMKPLQFLDMQTAQITWNAAYRKGKEYLKLAEEAAVNYADDVVTRTQGSGKISDLAQAQRTTVGKTMLMLQTFVNNNWSFIMRDVFGFSNHAMRSKDRFEKAMKLLIGIGITNVVFEDLLGTYSPFPTPVSAYLEARKEGSSVPGAAVRSLKEMSELIPGFGGAIRYGSHPLGPLAETLGAVPGALSGRPGAKSPQEVGGAILGIPMTSQIKKLITGRKRGAGLIESILGMKNPPTKFKKGRLGINEMGEFGELGLE